MPNSETEDDATQIPVEERRGYLRRVHRHFGSKFLAMLASAYLGVKGPLSQVIMIGQQPYFQKYLQLSGADYQMYGTVANTPWAMKALIGALSDSVYIAGYAKRWYIVSVSLLGTLGFLLLLLIPMTAAMAPLAALLFFLCSCEVATVDLLCEGKYAELMVKNPKSGSDIPTWVWAMYMLGSLGASAFLGPMADHFSVRLIFLPAIPLALQIAVPTLLGWLPEKPVAHQKLFTFRLEKVRQQPKVFLLGTLMAASALGLAFVTLLFDSRVQLFYSVAASVGLSYLTYRWLPRALSKAIIYLFLSQVTYLNLSGALDYYYTADPHCVPGGPNFDYTYYLTYTQLVGSIAGGVGVVLFQYLLNDRTFRTAFWTTILVKVLASFVDIALVKRWNVNILGVSDKWFYMLGDAIIWNVCYMLDFMPAVVLTSKVCPKGMESTVYAVLAGFQNFGSAVSRTIGLHLLELLNIQTLPPCDFSGLPVALVLGHLVLPLICIPLTFYLVPAAKLKDDILPGMGSEGNEIAMQPLATEDLDEDEDSPSFPQLEPAQPTF
eukprot:TRINITY_DN9465_c0_g1_i1.p1 TRINITY_DN9465_c0_g1~~TRINITY_DN9465_c0_g1_i1.p1  ORF type:complete len:549 (-),score=71.44 TRINITY_DN9465_c0_g1_i1:147-1793(-)